MTIASRIVIAIAIALPVQASAQNAEAELLFREGKKLLKDGEIAAACEKFAASEKLDPETGTELNLADCYEQNGQTASAWGMFVKAATTAKHSPRPERAAEAKKRASALEPRLVYLTVQVPPDHEVDDLEIKRNDTPIDRAEWNQPMPVDPGEYTFTAQAPRREAWTETVTVKQKNKIVEVPKLDRAKDATTTTDEPRPKRRPKHVVIEEQRPREYRTATIALAVGGVGAIVIGSGFAIVSKNNENQSEALCPQDHCTNQHGVDLNGRARLEGWVANISWGLGVAAIGGAVALYILGTPSRDAIAIAPVVTPSHAGIALEGRF